MSNSFSAIEIAYFTVKKIFNDEKYKDYTRDKMPIKIGKSIFKVESNGRAIVITRMQ